MLIPTGTGDGTPVDLTQGCLPFRFDPPRIGEYDLDVPKIVHFIWLGSEVPKKYIKNINDVQTHNPEYEVHLWMNTIPQMRNGDLYDQETNWGAKADLLRYEIVHRHGGIYLDVDHISHGPGSLHPDMQKSFVQVSGPPWNNTTNSDFGFAKGSEFLAYCITNLRDPRVRKMREIPERTGPTFFTTCVVSFGDLRIVHPNGRELLKGMTHTADHNWK